eukprot:TRINITY_DN56680_c0_g1_i1.p1 TRINITY_DN56680_c0_g1~~TRINITY_DN56680_c0_g1_i1.p1  ORF type:complete len:329 (+),score=57.08 TRINITY_DN56680_c0_g1_i1:98-988(+)
MLSSIFRWDESGGAARSRMLPKAINQLKEDFDGDNADAREADLARPHYERRIEEARRQSASSPRDKELQLKLAEAYGILDPRDARCLDTLQQLLGLGVASLDVLRRGDFWYLYGRSLFLADRLQESLLAFLQSKSCYKERGSKPLRRRTNTALLRTYAALGRSKLAAERLEVSLTMCDDLDETILLYTHARHALEQTGMERDASVLDDIWYVELDVNEKLREKFDSYNAMVKNLLKNQLRTGGSGKTLSWEDARRRLRKVAHDMSTDERLQTFFATVASLLLICFVLMAAVRAQQR